MTTPLSLPTSLPTSLPGPQRRVEHCMGTVFSIDVRTPGAWAELFGEVVQWLHWVDSTFSTYQPGSQVSRLARGELAVADCAPEVGSVLQRCAALADRTDGYFTAYPGGRLDPSGLVKGWAIESVSDRLAEAGAVDHCVNGGGDVSCRGSASLGQDWRVGIAHPGQPGMIAAVVAGTDFGVATSGSAERGTHIVDPHSGQPVDHFASVTVVGPSIATADAYATAAFAMGERAYDWIVAQPAYCGFIVRVDGSTWSSPGFTPAQPVE